MAVLPLLCFCLLVSIRFSFRNNRSLAIMDAAVLCTAAAVLIAEFTSLFHAYDILWTSILWAVILTLLVLYHRKCHIQMQGTRFFSFLRDLSKVERIMLGIITISVLIPLVKIAIAPPNSPYDSMVYHQPRAFMFYKNHSVHNFPAPKGHLLYFGPLNAMLMSQLQIMCFGSDCLYRMVQYGAYLLTILAVYRTTRSFGQSTAFSLLTATMASLFPMAHIQASTTQSDLLVTAFCITALSYMVQIFDSMKNKQAAYPMGSSLLLGLSCGLAVLSKLNAGVVLIGFVVLFAVFLFVRLRLRALPRLLLIALCALLLTSGHWYRNARDWEGDFLPLAYAGSRPDYERIGAKGTTLIVAKALAVTYASPERRLPAFLAVPSMTMAQTAAAFLNLDVDEPGTYESGSLFTGTVGCSPDNVSYPFHSLLCGAAILVCSIYAIRKRCWWLLGYVLAASFAILATATQYQWCNSYNRYLMPGFIAALPLGGIMLQGLCRKNGKRRAGAAALLILMFGFNMLTTAGDLYPDMLLYVKGGYTYDERILRHYDFWPTTLYRQVMDDVREYQYVNIGLGGRYDVGYYAWMRPFAAARYDVRFVQAAWRGDLEDEQFIPDCIIASSLTDHPEEQIQYHGVTYVRRFDPSSIYTDPGASDLFFVYYVKA